MTKGEVIKALNAPKHGENPIPVCVRMGNQDSSQALMIPDESIPIVENGKSSRRSLTLRIPYLQDNPQRLHEPASDLVIDALRRGFKKR
jgi:hypothetical protein